MPSLMIAFSLCLKKHARNPNLASVRRPKQTTGSLGKTSQFVSIFCDLLPFSFFIQLAERNLGLRSRPSEAEQRGKPSTRGATYCFYVLRRVRGAGII